jgi:hypothetical protein
MTLTYTPDCFGERLVRNQSAPIDWGSVVFFGGGQFPQSGNRYYDSSHRQNHGTLLPDMETGPQWVWDDYLQRWVMSFDGSNDYIRVPIPTLTVSSMTIAQWLWWDGSDVFVALRDYTQGAGTFFPWNNSGTIYYRVGGTSIATSATTTGFNAKWTHWTLTVSGTDTVLYTNGVAIKAATGGASALVTPLYWGRNGSSTEYSKIIGSDLFITNTALSAAQIAWLANPTNHLLVPTRTVYPVATSGGETPTFKPWWAARCNNLIGAGV